MNDQSLTVESSSSTQLKKHREPPDLVNQGRYLRASRIGWSHPTAFRYLLGHPGRFVVIDELARTFYHKVTDDARRKVRKNLPPLLRYTLKHHAIALIIEPVNERGRAGGIKIYDPNSTYEKELGESRAKKMRETGEMKTDEYQSYNAALRQLPHLPQA